MIALGAEHGYPFLIKAAAGGGGKGMKVVRSPATRRSRRSSRPGARVASYFADEAVYVERYLEHPRHVEVQVLADAHGNVVHLGERDCTIQRRHQKLVEETPSPAVDEPLRARIGAIAVDVARAAGYRSAGTIEGLLAADGSYYFMEMNTRIQVEHTVTELVSGHRHRARAGRDRGGAATRVQPGRDPVAGSCDRMPDQRRGSPVGASCRRRGGSRPIASRRGPVSVWTPASTWAPEVSPLYDPMIAKVIVHGADRHDAIGRMLRALGEYRIERRADARRFSSGAALSTMFSRR